MDMDGKPESGAKFFEFIDAGLGLTAKAEIAALVQAANAHCSHDNPKEKLLCCQASERGVERQSEHCINAGSGEQADSFIHRRQ
jgi:protein-disulfide isomerase